MVTLRSILAAAAGVGLLVQSSIAHSTSRGPLDYVTTITDARIGTRSRRVHSHSDFDLEFTLHDGSQRVRLVLEPNHDLISHDAVITFLGPDGRVKEAQTIERSSHRIYKGAAYVEREGSEGWSQAGWARITVHQDGDEPVFDGAFKLDGETHSIQLGKYYQHMKRDDDPVVDERQAMVVWRDSDIRRSRVAREEGDSTGQALCTADELDFNKHRHSAQSRAVNANRLFGRQDIDGGGTGNNTGVNFIDTIGSTSGCPTQRRVAMVGIALDCNYWNGFSSESAMKSHVFGVANQASQVYESSFNISLGITNITINEEGCPSAASEAAPWNVACSSNVNIGDRLSLFSKWRGQFADSNAYWSLFTQCSSSDTVGLSWEGQLCKAGSSPDGDSNMTIAAANVIVRTDTEWQIFAHESGHMFGAVHDCMSSTCPVDDANPQCCPLTKSTCNANAEFIMNPATGTGISAFSPCTIGTICTNLKGNVNSTCLVNNLNVPSVAGAVCGNGIVEDGEECDCGGVDNCQDNSCCDATTCKFKTGAACDPSNENCCTTQCQFASKGTVCRPSTGQCDIAETCSGTNSTCPPDDFSNNGQSCGNDTGLQCASGQCTSRNLQCQVILGGSGESTQGAAACSSDSGCQLVCQSAQFGPNECVSFSENFIDGTPCGGGGQCSAGSCQGSTTWDQIVLWIHQHLPIFIPVVVVIGLLILALILSLLLGCFRRARRWRNVPKQPEMQNNPAYYSSPDSTMSGAQMSGAHLNAPPPPPEYATAMDGHQQDLWGIPPPPAPRRSMRYA